MGLMAANRGPQVAAVAWMFLVLSWVAVSLRCYVRAIMTKSFGTDDWLAVGSLILFTLYCTFVLLGVKYGTGRHLADLPPENIPIAFKWWWCCELMYASCTAVFKASIAVFLLRICTQRSQIYVIWGVMASVMLFSTFYLFLLIFQCHPVSFFWTRFEGLPGKCVPPRLITDSTYAHSAVSAASDWTLGTLPIFLVWNLKMNIRTKISVALILALGAIGSTATIVRIPYLQQLMNTTDFLIATVDVAIWSTVEPGIGITCAALACCRPLIRNFLSRSRLWGTTIGRGGAGTSAWPSHGPSHAGYLRSGSKHIDELGVGFRSENRNANGKDHGTITTAVHSKHELRDNDEHDVELGTVKASSTRHHRSGSTHSLTGKHGMGWTMSDSKLADDSSEDYPPPPPEKDGGEWQEQKLRIGVRTTTEITSAPESVIGESSRAREKKAGKKCRFLGSG